MTNQTYSITARNKDTGEFVEVVTNSRQVNAAVEKLKQSGHNGIRVSEGDMGAAGRNYDPTRPLYIVIGRWHGRAPIVPSRGYKIGHGPWEFRTHSLEKAQALIRKWRQTGLKVSTKVTASTNAGIYPRANPLADGLIAGLAVLGTAVAAAAIYYATKPATPVATAAAPTPSSPPVSAAAPILAPPPVPVPVPVPTTVSIPVGYFFATLTIPTGVQSDAESYMESLGVTGVTIQTTSLGMFSVWATNPNASPIVVPSPNTYTTYATFTATLLNITSLPTPAPAPSPIPPPAPPPPVPAPPAPPAPSPPVVPNLPVLILPSGSFSATLSVTTSNGQPVSAANATGFLNSLLGITNSQATLNPDGTFTVSATNPYDPVPIYNQPTSLGSAKGTLSNVTLGAAPAPPAPVPPPPVSSSVTIPTGPFTATLNLTPGQGSTGDGSSEAMNFATWLVGNSGSVDALTKTGSFQFQATGVRVESPITFQNPASFSSFSIVTSNVHVAPNPPVTINSGDFAVTLTFDPPTANDADVIAFMTHEGWTSPVVSDTAPMSGIFIVSGFQQANHTYAQPIMYQPWSVTISDVEQ